jgi:hypothetical protein
MDSFASSHKKVERAKKYIMEIHRLTQDFSQTDFYTLGIEHEAKTRRNFLCIKTDTSGLPTDDIALAIGDAAHNLRSALDHLWYRTVILCGGVPGKYTRFPFLDAEDVLVPWLNEALKQGKITSPVVDLLLTSTKPYNGANSVLCGLHNLNIQDKHEMLVPVLEPLVAVLDVCLVDDQQTIIRDDYYLDESSRIALTKADGRKVTVQSKGKATAQIVFNLGTAFQGEPVGRTLSQVSEEVTRTIGEFELLGLGSILPNQV